MAVHRDFPPARPSSALLDTWLWTTSSSTLSPSLCASSISACMHAQAAVAEKLGAQLVPEPPEDSHLQWTATLKPVLAPVTIAHSLPHQQTSAQRE